MKESGYFYVNNSDRAAPDWRRFSAAAHSFLRFTSDSELSHAIGFLNREPPQVQGAALEWRAVPLRGADEVATALDAAQRVRHNLFHGGKHMLHSGAGRDENLVRAAITLLLACVSQCEALRTAYA